MLLIFKLALAEVKFVTGMGSAIKAGSHVPFKILLSVYFTQAYSSILFVKNRTPSDITLS